MDKALAVVKKCIEFGASETLVIRLNVMDNDSIRDAVKKIIDKFGRIDILINNAGVVVLKNLREQTFEDIENQVRTNLEGLIKITKACLPYIKDTIINIGSGAGLEGYEGLSTYCATKFGVRGFTQSIAHELNVNVFAVNPGTTATRTNNFRGMAPEKVADVILNTAKGNYNIKSGSDINVWELY